MAFKKRPEFLKTCLRNYERPEAVNAGTVELVTNKEKLLTERHLLSDTNVHRQWLKLIILMAMVKRDRIIGTSKRKF